MGRRIVLAVLGLALFLVAGFVLGPRVAVDTTIRFDPSAIGDDPQAYLAREEAAVPNIRDGLDKEIIWANPLVHARTKLAIVYIHGFSASKGEVRPLPDDVADALDANLFYTRLTGHGQDGAAMAEGSVNAWINDYEEALAIGRAIGDKVIVIATSTGGSLATWSATQPSASDGVAAIAFISPNFGVKASGAELLTMPWGREVAELVGGKQRSFPARNPLHERFWTTKYPMAATLPMAALTNLAYGAPVEKATVPALFIFSDADKVVRPDRTREIAGRWGGAHELVPVDDTGDPDNHVIAGDALSPQTTAFLTERIVVWVKALMEQQSGL
ncbi:MULTISPECIES: alpha/beta fold hydrolase [unclassified Mesorhizobium]|uniref:alpha/beta hydrolase n=1 Tax=unclassified Mesorhizobium TaxID=325217 RepID=UPI000FCABB9B|nr:MULTISPECIES: alpha/beta fold hydrolase [unclassified Mesorhizobium]TGP26798.1 alpha/beta fold hydrolase [Mesorhizobium sp. M1D.F.Ca.ET.231.01.1.1]TGP38755.1 alpha/beta fold hydrolase [Mesorhizobium sp. M1D.F.Ca.ET.234.01.1.1]TGS50964.1 alpha/beta fold hydrolase [Mesorhizobium sp. M1D.F.Ca.ET.184.01.1.1]TGS66848.1 alpha/beta fold hydrolase [Mesorhizobium sp. M1D.F.Ca.ET.183.01.1.1]